MNKRLNLFITIYLLQQSISYTLQYIAHDEVAIGNLLAAAIAGGIAVWLNLRNRSLKTQN
ncbi:hypothetical protein [Salinibius halmophilus]|uniref:hypothetical protein n=1 Tax=Salinibius halmophilus TaxID=1853216 RepID=UPI000E673B34|nr:hypothetical protein [Salinibius halmophilus]